MAGFAVGLALKSLQWLLRAIEFCCAAIVLAIYSYFLATLHNHDLHIDNFIRAIEGISGAAVLYLVLGLLLLFCLSGFAFFSFLGILLDIAFMGAFIYVAFENRHGANSCTGNVNTVFGSGPASSRGDGGTGGVIRLPTLRTACRLETAVFAVSIVAIFFFLLSSLVEFGLGRHHQREKRFGPSPQNNYTQGYGRRRRMPWQRKPKDETALGAGALHPDALPAHQTPADVTRTSYQSTEATAVNGTEPAISKYDNSGVGGYHASSSTPYQQDNTMYDRYANGSGYRIPDVTDVPANERAEMPAEIPVSQYAKNY